MDYLSLFSGIGGLEHPRIAPILLCEEDRACQLLLRAKYPEVPIIDDIHSLTSPPKADFVVGGWPCQDVSAAGKLGGINASRSGLFFEMLNVAGRSGAHTLVGENVPNLLWINGERDFRSVLAALEEAGYPYIAWRILNARQFGLPQHRRRLFVVASQFREHAEALHSAVPTGLAPTSTRTASGFYWTGGKRSICFCVGYVPALKIGAGDNKGRAPVAVMIGSQIRKLTTDESLKLQGLGTVRFEGVDSLAESTLLRMAGNAVPTPMGSFVLDAVAECRRSNGTRTSFGRIEECGMSEEGMVWGITHPSPCLATNLVEFLEERPQDSLSAQAAAGLIVRSVRSGHSMPIELFERLWELSRERGEALRGSRSNSFVALDSMQDAVLDYRSKLVELSEYRESADADDEEGEPEHCQLNLLDELEE